MKIIKTTSGNKISISRKEWEDLGKKAGFSSTDGFDSVDKLVNRLKEEAGTQESTLADKWAIVAGNLQGILGGIISDVQSASEGYWHVSSAATELGIADNLKKINELVQRERNRNHEDHKDGKRTENKDVQERMGRSWQEGWMDNSRFISNAGSWG